MSADKLEALGPALSELGWKAIDIANGDANALFLYVEAAEGWIGPSLFKDEGDHVRYLDIPRSSGLTNLLIAARETEPDLSKRWSIMEYVIEDGKFEAKFKFADEVDVEAPGDSIERRDRFLKARYGDKPIVYPPMPGHAFELRPHNVANEDASTGGLPIAENQRLTDPMAGRQTGAGHGEHSGAIAKVIDVRLTMSVDVAHLFVFHPADLEHAAGWPIDWYAQPGRYHEESGAGRLIAWCTRADGMYDVRVTNAGLSEAETRYAGPHWEFPFVVRHRRIYVDNVEGLPGAHQFENPYENARNWIDVPNGNYRVTVTGVDWALEPGVAEDGSNGLPDFVVHFELTNEAVAPARRPPFIEPFRNATADDSLSGD